MMWDDSRVIFEEVTSGWGSVVMTVGACDALPDLWSLIIKGAPEVEDPFINVPSVDLALHSDHVHLSGLYVPLMLRGKALGSILMSGALRWAQERWPRLPVTLDVHPFGRERVTKEFLTGFYGRHGFEVWPGHPYCMVKWPKEGVNHG